MSKTRIAFLTPGFGADEADTNCVPAIQDFLLGLRERQPNLELTVFSLRYPHTRARYSWYGIDVFPANGRQLGFPAVVPSWTRLAGSFVQATRRRPVHLIHSFWLGECAMIGELLSRFYGIPHVVTLMGQEVNRENRYARLLKCRSTTFVAVSQFQRRHLLSQCGNDVHHVIPWGIPELKMKDAGARDIDVLGVGSLTDVKDFDTFLNVVSLVRSTRPALTCHIAGEGPNLSLLKARARALGLGDVIKFEGWIPREHVFELMLRSRVLLHTSRFESFGLVFAEARACGARIVSRPVGIAESGPTWFVSDDPQGMAAAVSRYLKDPSPAKAILRSVESTVIEYGNLYKQMCGFGDSSMTAE